MKKNGLQDTLHAVLERFGIEPESIRDIRTGRVNRHWRVAARGREYALRRYQSPPYAPRPLTHESITFEHRALRHAARKRWPVAVPTKAGRRSLVAHGGSLYALFPFLSGRPAPYGHPRYLETKGALLARLHGDMASLSVPAQRSGFRRMHDLDQYMGNPDTFDAMMRTFAREHRELARIVSREHNRCLQRLERLRYEDLPTTFCHFDFHHDNVLFAKGRFTGLLDFDSSHVDTRVADIATSVRLDCMESPGYVAIQPAAVQSLIAGYTRVSPLTAQELSLIVPLTRLWFVAEAATRITQWLSAPDEYLLAKVRRTTHGRMPAFDERAQAIQRSVTYARLPTDN